MGANGHGKQMSAQERDFGFSFLSPFAMWKVHMTELHYKFSSLSQDSTWMSYSRLQIGLHRILRLFLKTSDLVPGVPGFSWDLSLVPSY